MLRKPTIAAAGRTARAHQRHYLGRLLAFYESTQLAPVLRDAVARAGLSGDCAVLCEFSDQVVQPRAVCHELALILHEALLNALTHAQARQVLCQLTQVGSEIELRVTDDGCGFLPNFCRYGSGLMQMYARTASLGGELIVQGVPGCGSSIHLRLPISP